MEITINSYSKREDNRIFTSLLFNTSRGDPRCWFWIITRMQVISRWQIICPLTISIPADKSFSLATLSKYWQPWHHPGESKLLSQCLSPFPSRITRCNIWQKHMATLLKYLATLSKYVSTLTSSWGVETLIPMPFPPFHQNHPLQYLASKHSGNPEQTEGLILTWP